jgi:hypothetical protein
MWGRAYNWVSDLVRKVTGSRPRWIVLLPWDVEPLEDRIKRATKAKTATEGPPAGDKWPRLIVLVVVLIINLILWAVALVVCAPYF